MSDEQWGPWIEHDGKGCPVANGTLTHCVWQDGHERVAEVSANGRPASENPWIWADDLPNIIRYRIRKPRALLDLIERARELDDAPEGPVRTPAPNVTA